MEYSKKYTVIDCAFFI